MSPRSGRSSGRRGQGRGRYPRFRCRAAKDRADRAAGPTASVAKPVRWPSRPPFLSAVRWSLALAELLHGFVPMALHQMVVDHADRLHEGIDDGRSDELEAVRQELLGDLLRQRSLSRNLFGILVAVDLRPAVEEVPQE